MVCRTGVCLVPGTDAVSSLVVGRLAAHCVAAQLRSVMRLRACKSSVLAQAVLALIFSTPCAWAATGAGVPAQVTQVIAVQRLPPSAVSFDIVDPDSDRLVLGQNPDTPGSRASTVKVVTTFAALALLGPAYTWHTRASIRGALDDGVLDGDLILQGGGDPYMTLERWWSFVHALRAKGLKTIHGNIVVDNTLFSLPPEGPGEFDGRPNRSYNVVPDALMVNFQSIEFRVLPDAGARRVEVLASPTPVNLSLAKPVSFLAGRCR